MKISTFILLLAVMIVALALGLRASGQQKQRLRQQILADKEQLAGVIEVVRQGKSFQAESLLVAQGRPRSAARMTVVLIKKLLKTGELD